MSQRQGQEETGRGGRERVGGEREGESVREREDVYMYVKQIHE